MAEYIERDEAIRKAQDACIKIVFGILGRGITQFDAADIVDVMESVPTADVVEVKHGKWKPIVKQDNYFEPPYWDTCKCSVCEYEIDICETVYNYCPNCGAKMDGRSDTDDR